MVQVEKIVKINKEGQNALIRTFSRLPTNEKIEVMSDHRKLMYKLKQTHDEVGVEILSYSALIIAIQVYQNDQNKLNRLNIGNLSLKEIRKITSQKARVFLQKQFRKQTKRERLLGYWAVVSSLKNDEKYSFRKIETYLKKHHKFEVSYSLIAKVWDQLENKKELENG